MAKTTGDMADDFLAKRNERAAAQPNPLASPPAAGAVAEVNSPSVDGDDDDDIELAVDEAINGDAASSYLAKRNARSASKPNPLKRDS